MPFEKLSDNLCSLVVKIKTITTKDHKGLHKGTLRKKLSLIPLDTAKNKQI